MTDDRERISRLLEDLAAGESDARDDLIPLVYDSLHRLAKKMMRGEPAGRTLQTTALVHEAFLKLVDQRSGFASRAHFFKAAAVSMRRILVDQARRRASARRDEGRRIEFETNALAGEDGDDGLLALNEALEAYERLDPRGYDIVMLRYFSGLEVAETAELLDISTATVKREWSAARLWLHRRMTE